MNWGLNWGEVDRIYTLGAYQNSSFFTHLRSHVILERTTIGNTLSRKALWSSIIVEIFQTQYHCLNLKSDLVCNYIVSDSTMATYLNKRDHRIMECENPNSTRLTSLSSKEIEGQRLLYPKYWHWTGAIFSLHHIVLLLQIFVMFKYFPMQVLSF